MRRLLLISVGLLPMLCGIVLGLRAASVSHAATAAGNACEQIRAACEAAGFVLGGAKAGKGLQVDCVNPIIRGTERAKNRNSLPPIDPEIVAACRANDPRLNERGDSPSKASAPPPLGPAAATAQNGTSQAPSPAARHPNIVFVLTDDLAWNLVAYMPHVLKMRKDGVTFSNYFVTDSLCCPSRSSIFTGRYPHDTGVFRNTGSDGGYLVFHSRGHESATFANAISASGYRTAMLGKYLNGYLPLKHGVPPGWTSWSVAGAAYREFAYNLNQNGRVVHYGNSASDYLTDVLSGLAASFIKQSGGAPFIIEIATFAPHAPYTPAPRDAAAFPGLRAPRTPAFNAEPDANAPKWLLRHRALSDADMANIDRDFRKRAQAVLAVDKMIGELQAAVTAIGAEKNTYFIFSSDNGYHMGEHRLMPGKMTAYDTDIRVPLIVTGPGVPAGATLDEIVENVDLYPTFIDIAGATAAANIDGRSLLPLLHGQRRTDWRTVGLVEHHGPVKDPADPDMPALRSGNPTTYEAIRSAKYVYVEYADGEKEFHDLAGDPNELRNTFSALSAEDKETLHATIGAAKNCHDARSCAAAERPARSLARK